MQLFYLKQITCFRYLDDNLTFRVKLLELLELLGSGDELLGSGDENKLLRKELLKYQTQKQGQSNGKKTKAKYGRFPSYSK